MQHSIGEYHEGMKHGVFYETTADNYNIVEYIEDAHYRTHNVQEETFRMLFLMQERGRRLFNISKRTSFLLKIYLISAKSNTPFPPHNTLIGSMPLKISNH